MNAKPVVKLRRSSETRQRSDQVGLRLLPAEKAALSTLAKRHGHASVQSLILDALQPILATVDDANLRQKSAL